MGNYGLVFSRIPAGIQPGSGWKPAGHRLELKAFLEASGAADFCLKNTRSWNVEHAKMSKSVKTCENI